MKRGFILIMFLAFLLPNISQAVDYQGVGGRPAYPRAGNPRTDSIFVHTVDHSEIIYEGVNVINNTSEEKTLTVYAVDSVIASGGALTCAQYVDQRVEVGSWIKLEKEEIVIPAMSFKLVLFIITIPDKVDVGEHNGCIVVQEKKETKQAEGTGINLSFRTGLRVALTVRGEIRKGLEIVEFSVSENSRNTYDLKTKLINTGNVSLDADIDIKTTNFWGSLVGSHGGEFVLVRGEISNYNFELEPPFWGGWLRSELTATYDGNPASEIGDESEAQYLSKTQTTERYFVMPSKLALIYISIIIILIIALVVFLVLYYRRQKWIKDHWVGYKIKADDDIQKLAVEYRVSWKLIVKVNKLEPPYILEEDVEIILPIKK